MNVPTESILVPDFNSRPCERGFGFPIAMVGYFIWISIHAPARGASRMYGAILVLS